METISLTTAGCVNRNSNEKRKSDILTGLDRCVREDANGPHRFRIATICPGDG